MSRWNRMLLAWALCGAASAAWADVPRTIHYQGRLTDANGTPLAGEHMVTLRLYDAAEQGTQLWEEKQTLVLPRQDGGVFSVILGSVTPFPATLLFNDPVWLTTEVDGTGELLPRQPLSSVSSALNADRLDGLDSTDLLRLLQAGAPTSPAPAPSAGDITSVTAGVGLAGGAVSGDAALALAVPVAVAHGGTGATALTVGGVLLGGGTGPITSTGALPKGAMLVGNGAAGPALLPPGSDGALLAADSSQAAGVKWLSGCWPIGGADASNRSGTFQLAAFGGGDTGERSDHLWPVPAGGTLASFHAALGQAPGGKGSWTVRLRKNGANAALTCTIAGNATACAASGQEALAAGDQIGVEFAQTGNAAGTQGAAWSACFAAR